ncbi:MAG: hypothetical protein VSS52_006030 [Thiotrichaceae bacterium]|nr:hypothetical protein [Thiotrichaceae bacterium]
MLFILIFLTLTQTSCNINKLSKVIDVSDNKRACIVGVWPAVQDSASNQKFKMTHTQAYNFISNTKAEVDKEFKNQYHEFRLNRKKIPQTCKQYLWTSNISEKKYRTQCMAVWAKNSKPKACNNSSTYVIGSTIVNGTAKLQVVRLSKPTRPAHKRIRIVRGTTQSRLAKNLGQKIRKEMKTLVK